MVNGYEKYGIPLYPASKAIIGSQQIPWIYEDRLNGEDVVNALEQMYNLKEAEREEMGLLGRKHVMKNYNFDNFNKTWTDLLLKIYEEEGSWENRNYNKHWTFKEIG